MNRRTVFLLIALALSLIFAGWQWFRPYEWMPEAGARYRIEYAAVKEDHGFCWLDLSLERAGNENHDLTKPVLLVTSDGRELQPSDMTLGGPEDGDVGTLFFRFWLEAKDLSGSLKLKLNDGTLSIRSGQGVPVADGESQSFYTTRW